MNLGVCVVCEVEGMDTKIKRLNQDMICKICAKGIEEDAKAEAQWWNNESTLEREVALGQ